MVSGFLVRHDGALISIDHIAYVIPDRDRATAGSLFNIYIYLQDGHALKWCKESRIEPEIRALLHELKELIKRAIEL